MSNNITRRSALGKLAGSAAVLSATSMISSAAEGDAPKAKLKGNIHHSVSKWCYGSIMDDSKTKPGKITYDEFCKKCAQMGIESVELLGENEWETIRKNGLSCAMCNGPDGIGYGFNRVEHHDDLLAKFEKAIPKVAEFKFPNIICFSGVRKGMSDEQGMENCVKGLKRIVPIAEKYKVTVVMELLNSKVDHKDYMADHTAWGAEVCKRVGSDYVKLLYDIYHMQIMEGDVIRTIKEYNKYIAHYHTGGNPGRNEIDETQEIYYPSIMKAIVATGYKGFVGQEFIPKRDALKSLEEAVKLCDV